jgi:ABC-2 type transport system permease protein
VDVLIYRLPNHDSNDQNIIKGIRDAIAYYEERLAPFPYSQFKVVEFPLIEGSHATLFGDLMPMSEIRFLDGSAHDINKIDLSYYIPAHETGHLWWGNLCLPAKGKGARVLTESLTEFSTLQIYQNKYGTEAGIDFIEKQRYRYLQGRAHNDNEVPLMDAGKDDDFLTYGKGTLTLHALSLIWSADSLNHALRSFLEAYCHATPPYPTSKIFFDHIHSVLPDSIQEWWHLKLATKEIDDIKIISAQIENDSLVVEIEQANSHMSVAYTDILLEDESGRSLALQRIRVMPGSNTYTIPFTGSVTSVRLDPYHLLIERHRDDNLLIISH